MGLGCNFLRTFSHKENFTYNLSAACPGSGGLTQTVGHTTRHCQTRPHTRHLHLLVAADVRHSRQRSAMQPCLKNKKWFASTRSCQSSGFLFRSQKSIHLRKHPCNRVVHVCSLACPFNFLKYRSRQCLHPGCNVSKVSLRIMYSC